MNSVARTAMVTMRFLLYLITRHRATDLSCFLWSLTFVFFCELYIKQTNDPVASCILTCKPAFDIQHWAWTQACRVDSEKASGWTESSGLVWSHLLCLCQDTLVPRWGYSERWPLTFHGLFSSGPELTLNIEQPSLARYFIGFRDGVVLWLDFDS